MWELNTKNYNFRLKDYEKQEKRIKELKAAGQSKKKAESKQKEALTRKQQKNQSKLSKNDDEDTGPTELLEKPKEYIVRFRFPEVSQLQPPILGLYNVRLVFKGLSLDGFFSVWPSELNFWD